MSCYKQSIIDNTNWSDYEGPKDKARRYLLLNDYQKTVGVPLTTTIKTGSSCLELKKSGQPKNSLDEDSYVDFFHFATSDQFQDSKKDLSINSNDVIYKIKEVIGVQENFQDKKSDKNFEFRRGKVFEYNQKKWLIVSPNYFNDSNSHSLICLPSNGREIWSYYKQTLGIIRRRLWFY